jgi:rod shape-determining protein MreC
MPVITSPPKQASRPQRADRPRVLVFVAMLVLGTGVSAVERFRPGVIEPVRHRLSSSLSGYFRPLLEATQGGRRLANRVGQLWGVESDFRRLERELMETRLELQLAREQLHRMGRISGLRQWRGPEELEFALADVIGFSTGGASAEWIINRGAMDGMEVGLPVVGQNGLAGVIREVSDRTSRVQALTDPQSAVGVAEREDRNRGIVFGAGRDMPLEFIPENENTPILPGSQLITSGFGNSIYPKGIVVGTVKARRRNFRGVDFGVVEPAETFNALEEVLVIMRAAAAPAPGPLEGLGAYSFVIEPEGEGSAGDAEGGADAADGPPAADKGIDAPPTEQAPQ